MALRIWEYIGEIVRKERTRQEIHYNRSKVYPIVVPIVIYTGYQKWNARTNFAEKQYQSIFYEKYKISLEYNLISVQDYTFDELLEKRSLLGNIMIIEKCKKKEEISTQVNKMIEMIEETKDREILSEIVSNIIEPIIGAEKAKEMLEKINEKEEVSMSPFTKMLLDLEIKGERRGRKKGKLEGKLETIKETVKNMLQLGETEEKIVKYMGISKEELENIKSMN